MNRLLAQHVAPRRSEPLHGKPAARRSSLGSPKLKAVLSGFWAIFHAGNAHSRANRGGAARCEQPGVRGVARAARAHNGLFAGSRSRHSMFHCKISATLRLLDIYSFLVNLG